MKQAMIFAAGLGTRLRPLTDTIPKALVPVNGQPLLHHVILRLKAAGVERIVVNVHHFGQQIIDDLAANHHFGMDIRISDERDLLLETGGGIKHAARLFDPEWPILIHNVDILSNVNLEFLWGSMKYTAETAGCKQTEAALLVSQRQTKRYLLFGENQELAGWTNIETGQVKTPHPDLCIADCRRRAFSGIHLFSPSLFPLMASWPEKFSIVDFYLQACAGHRIIGVEQAGLRLMDVGKLDTLSEADAFAASLNQE